MYCIVGWLEKWNPTRSTYQGQSNSKWFMWDMDSEFLSSLIHSGQSELHEHPLMLMHIRSLYIWLCPLISLGGGDL